MWWSYSESRAWFSNPVFLVGVVRGMRNIPLEFSDGHFFYSSILVGFIAKGKRLGGGVRHGITFNILYTILLYIFLYIRGAGGGADGVKRGKMFSSPTRENWERFLYNDFFYYINFLPQIYKVFGSKKGGKKISWGKKQG